MTQLIEFKNHKKEVLRGLIDKADSNKGIIFIHGFERTTIDARYKNIVDSLKGKINLFRFDFSGCGLSDGKFEDMTVEKSERELEKAIKIFKKHCPRLKDISLVAHSLGCCVGLKYLSDHPNQINRVVFFAPSFNQRRLHRYLFVRKFKTTEITWQTFKKYFSEKEFQAWLRNKKIMTREHRISNQHFLENKEIDFQYLFNNFDFDFKNILIVHGRDDQIVPLMSNNKLPREIKVIKVDKGDHGLRRPDMVKQYFRKMVDFLKK